MVFRADQYWEERLRDNYNNRGVGDIGLPESYNSWLYAVRGRVFRRVVNDLPVTPATSTILDVGSGTGFYLREWTRLGATNLLGCDITETAVSRLANQFRAATITQADIGDESFSPPADPVDVISAFDVLFHIVDDRRYKQAIENIAKSLSPGGWFLYSDNLVEKPTATVHYKSRGEQDILQTLSNAGFKIRKRVPVFVLMNDPVSSRNRLLRKWFSLVYRAARRGERMGRFVGRMLFPLELIASRIVRRAPSTEILVCQRD
jgi:SAM-dependent methyltransferase